MKDSRETGKKNIMNFPEMLCDLTMLKAQYRENISQEGDRIQYFELQILTEGIEIKFDVPSGSGDLFARELEVLASIVRARVVKQRLTGSHGLEAEVPFH
jgi:hypothetical protein